MYHLKEGTFLSFRNLTQFCHVLCCKDLDLDLYVNVRFS